MAVSAGNIDRGPDPDTPVPEILLEAFRNDPQVRAAYPDAKWNDEAFWSDLLYRFNPGLKP